MAHCGDIGRGRVPQQPGHDRRQNPLGGVGRLAQPQPGHRQCRHRRPVRRRLPYAAAGPGLGQRHRVHQPRSQALLRAGAHHLHPLPTLQARTIRPTSSRRTGRPCARSSATTATKARRPAPPSTPSTSPCACISTSSSRSWCLVEKTGTAPRSRNATITPKPPTSGSSTLRVAEAVKARLRSSTRRLNPAALLRQIETRQQALWKLAIRPRGVT